MGLCRGPVLLWVALATVAAVLAGCSTGGSPTEGGGGAEESFADAVASATTLEVVVAEEDAALCSLLEEAHAQVFVIDVLPPTDAELEAIAQMPDVAPEGMQEAAEAYADWNAAIQQGLADPLDEDVEALLAEVSDEELSAASRALWTFGVEHCGLADPAGLTGPSSEGILGGRNDAEREDGETDGPLDPDSIRADLTAAEDAAVKAILVARGSAGAHVQIVVAASAGQEGAMTVCEAVSTYLYDGIEERRVGISIEADDLSFWASRFNDTADCQSGS